MNTSYVSLPYKPTGLVFDYINNKAFALGYQSSTVRLVDLETATLDELQYNVVSATPIVGRRSTTRIYTDLCAYDPYRQKLLLVSPETDSVQIVNIKTGLLEFAETNVDINDYNKTLLDVDRGFAYVLRTNRYIRIYSLESNTVVNEADVGVGNVYWMTFDSNKRILIFYAGTGVPGYVYDPDTNTVSRWGNQTFRFVRDESDVLYIPELNGVVYVGENNRVYITTETSTTTIDSTITADKARILYHKTLQRIIVTTNTDVRIYDLSGNLVVSQTFPSDILYSDLDDHHDILALIAGNTVYVYKLTDTDLVLQDAFSTASATYFGLYLDSVFSRLYVLEHDAYRLLVYDYAEKLQVNLDIQRGATEWTGAQFNDQLTITVKTSDGTPVADAFCECQIFGNAQFNVDGQLVSSTTTTTTTDGTAQLTITVTGPGAYTVYVRASK